MIWHFLLAWLGLCGLCTALWIRAGLRLTRMQERNRFASDTPLRYLELDASQYRRLQ